MATSKNDIITNIALIEQALKMPDIGRSTKAIDLIPFNPAYTDINSNLVTAFNTQLKFLRACLKSWPDHPMNWR